MNFKIKTIGGSSFVIGVLAAIIAAGALLLAGEGMWLAAGVIVLCFCIGYVIATMTMRRFVLYKLRPMFQFIFKRDIDYNELYKRYLYRPKMMDNIEGDITAWAESSQKEIARLKDAEHYRKEYVGNVSHELKTPIFNVQGYISTLLDGAIDDSSVNRKYLERAEKSIERLINIVTDLDEISSLESGLMVLHKERFDIVALAREAIESVELEAAKKDIRITISNRQGASLHPLYVFADKHLINQVFVNLLVNSIRYGKQGGHTSVSFIDMFDSVMVEITDNGIGIGQQDLARVFERFYRTDKGRSREQGGTGLGLSIVKHIMDAHGENINVRSKLGQGSTFSFTVSRE
jgi:two-component system phosphate regulon sensor histidine kinase PhoR